MNRLPWDRKASDLADVAGTPKPQVCGIKTPLSATPGSEWLGPRPRRGQKSGRDACSAQARVREGPRAWAHPASAARGAGSFHLEPSALLPRYHPHRAHLVTSPGTHSEPCGSRGKAAGLASGNNPGRPADHAPSPHHRLRRLNPRRPPHCLERPLQGMVRRMRTSAARPLLSGWSSAVTARGWGGVFPLSVPTGACSRV